MSFLVPADAQISVTGAGRSGPETTTLRDNKSYRVYTYSDLKAGQTLNINLAGTAVTEGNTQSDTNNLLAAGAAFLGIGVLGAGIWWWRRSDHETEVGTDAPDHESTFDELINQIALLGETYEQQGLSMDDYQAQQRDLMQKAKHLA
jgi:hypothetical protein